MSRACGASPGAEGLHIGSKAPLTAVVVAMAAQISKKVNLWKIISPASA
jgi:hypothetical protein